MALPMAVQEIQLPIKRELEKQRKPTNKRDLRWKKKDTPIYIVAWRVMLMHACMDATSCGVMEVSLSVGRQETAELLSIEEVNISNINERVSDVKALKHEWIAIFKTRFAPSPQRLLRVQANSLQNTTKPRMKWKHFNFTL